MSDHKTVILWNGHQGKNQQKLTWQLILNFHQIIITSKNIKKTFNSYLFSHPNKCVYSEEMWRSTQNPLQHITANLGVGHFFCKFLNFHQIFHWDTRSSVVEFQTQDPKVVGSNPVRPRVLCSWARHFTLACTFRPRCINGYQLRLGR